MKNIAIIPARCGSKGLKNKNIKELNGIPLLAYSIKAAQVTGLFDEIMVSTDSQLYADISVEHGATVPFLRSKEQSGDNAGTWDVVKEVLAGYLKNGKQFDTVCLLQPTSPLRKAEDILKGYEELQIKDAEAITSVCEMDHSPIWSMVLPEDNSLIAFRKALSNIVPRQKLKKYYRINGALYIRKIQYTGDSIVILDSKEYAVIMDRRSSIDIDVAEDFEMTEYFMSKKDALV